MSITFENIKKIFLEHKSTLLKKYPIQKIGFFGSYARNEQTENSDLDILVEFNGRIGIRFIDLAQDLEDIFNVKVDLVSKKSLKERYLKHILKDVVYV